jgi:hypothetical protein
MREQIYHEVKLEREFKILNLKRRREKNKRKREIPLLGPKPPNSAQFPFWIAQPTTYLWRRLVGHGCQSHMRSPFLPAAAGPWDPLVASPPRGPVTVLLPLPHDARAFNRTSLSPLRKLRVRNKPAPKLHVSHAGVYRDPSYRLLHRLPRISPKGTRNLVSWEIWQTRHREPFDSTPLSANWRVGRELLVHLGVARENCGTAAAWTGGNSLPDFDQASNPPYVVNRSPSPTSFPVSTLTAIGFSVILRGVY